MWPFSQPEKRQATITQNASAEELILFFGAEGRPLGTVNTSTALKVPAVFAAVTFLSRTLASLPLHVYKETSDGPEKVTGSIGTLVSYAPNEETSSFRWRLHFWHGVFTGGRGLTYIERSGSNIVGLWGIDPTKAKIKRDEDLRTTYKVGTKSPYPAANVIDVPFLLQNDGISHYGPISRGQDAIGLAKAMNDFASGFFTGGGVPPLAVKGPMPAGKEAIKRAQAQIQQAIEASRESNIPITNLPAGYELVPIGFEPEKGQMTDGRRFQVEEIARLFNLPPVFLQDLTHGTFSNTEQQDLHLVKHVISQWAVAFEQEANLKLFGQRNNKRYIKHNLDGLMRGDFTSRMEGLAQGIQNAILTPNEARKLENRPSKPLGDDLLIQGATVPLGSQPDENSDTSTGADGEE